MAARKHGRSHDSTCAAHMCCHVRQERGGEGELLSWRQENMGAAMTAHVLCAHVLRTCAVI